MQGTIAQIVALTAFGNAFLADVPGAYRADFYPTNSTFVFCKEVKFVDLKRDGDKWRESPYADNPDTFFRRLKSEGYKGFRLSYGPSGEKAAPDRMLVGFVGGGGRWLLEAIGPRGSDIWEARWAVGNQNDPDRKIWHVTYGRLASGVRTENSQQSQLEQLKVRLSTNLVSIADFSRRQKLDGFTRRFEAGLAQIGADEPLKSVYHSDIAPKGLLPKSAYQLLFAAQAAWVFGGMGSWNDLGFQGQDQETYDKLSEELYQLLNAAIVQATNTSFSGEAKRPWWQLWN